MRFVHLRLHSAYSLAEGAIKMEKLVKLCERYKMPAVAVTDTNNLFGAMDFSEKCATHGIQPIIAVQLNVQHPKKNDDATSVLLYAKNQNGYKNLMRLVSESHLNSSSSLHPEVCLNCLASHSDDLILATGGIYGSLGKFLLENDVCGAKEYFKFLKRYFDGRLYVELSRHNSEAENKIEEDAISLAYDLNLPLVATNNVCYSEQKDFNSHDALICISQGKTIYETDRNTSSPEFYFKSPEEMTRLFDDLPEAIRNTEIIAQRCAFMLKKIKPFMPVFQTADGKTQDQELTDMAVNGLEERLQHLAAQPDFDEDFDEFHKKYFQRLDYELGIIQKMGFSGYFLIVADYVRWAKSQNIPVGPGRGSGAGSIVAWAIKITEVNPIRFTLFFERFLNPDRVSMPDFDVDFCQSRREEVIGYVQKKYGHNSVSQIVTFGKLQAKAVVRDVGRVLGLPYGYVDKISKLIPFSPTHPLTLQEAIDSETALQEIIDDDPQVKNLMNIALNLEGLYRQAGIHAAGVVISDKNLLDLVPLYKDPKSDMPVTQFSMKYVENAGLIKFDFLGLKTLTVIQKALDLVNARYGKNLQANDIPVDDVKTFELLKSLNCVGVFQIESGGMREVLKQMQPDRLEDIMALVALYRPGPMDDIPRYIACKHGREPIEYLDEKLEPILAETYGVMVYQEQVMQIAQEISGYSLGQADILRRAMGKKHLDEMQEQQKFFLEGAIARGMKKEIAERLFDQMSKFASYGFNKSHATAYGIITYQTAYLKANYTIEYITAIMTLDMLNTDKLYVYFQDAKKNGIAVELPDINRSETDFSIDYENHTIIYSLAAIKGSGIGIAEAIVADRKENGNFTSIFDFAERMSVKKLLNKRFLENFIKSGAFDKLHPNRAQLMNSIEAILAVKVSSDQELLFEKTYPQMPACSEWREIEKLQYEFDAIGFYLSSHPMNQYEELRKKLRFQNIIEAQEFARSRVAVIINDVTIKTTKNQNKFCILNVSDIYGTAEVTLFSEALESYRDLLKVGNVVALTIFASKNEDKIRLTANNVQIFNENFQDAPRPYFGMNNFTQQKKQTAKFFEIYINNSQELHAFGELSNNFKKNGNCTVKLLMPNAQKKMEIILPDKYDLGSYDILDIKNIVGVNNVKITEIHTDEEK